MNSDRDDWAVADLQPTMLVAYQRDGSLGCLADIPEKVVHTVAWHLDNQFGVDRADPEVDNLGSVHAVDSLRGTEIVAAAAELGAVHRFVVAVDYFVLMVVAVGQGLVLHDMEHCLLVVGRLMEVVLHHHLVAAVVVVAARQLIGFVENLVAVDWHARPKAVDSDSDMASELGFVAKEHPAPWGHGRGAAYPVLRAEVVVPADRRSFHVEDPATEQPKHVAAAIFEQYSLWDRPAAPNTQDSYARPHDT